jgi:hypothetical protein
MVLQSLANIGGGLRRTLADTSPAVTKDPFKISRGYHSLLRQYYENEQFSDAQMWQTYRAKHRLPRALRAIYNPTRRAVDWYAGRIYAGAWTEDGKPLPDGTPHALQFPSDVIEGRPQLVLAAIQALNWGNWRTGRIVYVREKGIVGTVLVEIVDDLERLKVYPEIVPIEKMASVRLDVTGNVKEYELQYKALDTDTGRDYDYRKVVTPESFTEYRDRTVTREDPNPYGFVPAALVQHRSSGSVFGAPAIAGVIPKIEEINRVATDVHNYIAKLQKQPVVFYGNDAPAPSVSRGASDESIVLNEEQSVSWFHSKDPSGHVDPMMQMTAPIGDAGVRIDKLMEEIEADLPELTLDRELRAMSNVTGPGADRMMGDVRGRYDEVQANADAGTVKIIQMCVAIGGWRLSQGNWGSGADLSRQQQKFDGFDLDSYARGDLDLSLLPRPLVAPTEHERLLALQLRKDVAGLSDDEVRRQLGMSPEEITTINTELTAQNERSVVAVF